METIDVVVGRIGKPHGLRGEVTVDVRTDEPGRRFAPGAELRGVPPRGSAVGERTLTVRATRDHQGVLLVTFEELADRTAAEAARGTVLHTEVPADAVPDDPDEYYDHQLVGLTVLDRTGERLGEVEAVLHLPSDDVLVVRGPRGGLHLPFRAEVVSTVDLASQRLVVDADGLRDGLASGDDGG